ncbi:GntR family transcriptional regulator [Kineosporia succinea]|uniref:DNA-binding GntR family transcriptional regulator n=1 Tax=Kineosporia succinea TaxID=84632 RepID=A0ABT9P9A9_9ACTN|nr:GntR family transcriptional regulator [Kineosporia succinea]MDP9829282.1 DNA-binding GntR family transcriptional regulator [Kineosporia succinea]
MNTIGSRHRSLRDETVDELRRLILSGEVGPGERLSELSISQRLGVSRLPVREAFRRLEAEGLLVSIPRRGVRVAELDSNELATVREIRMALEVIAVNKTVERNDPTVMQALRDSLERGRSAAETDDRAALSALNEQFHELLAEGAGSHFLTETLRAVRNQAHHLVGGMSAAVGPSWDEHAAIIRATVEGDAELAAMLMRRHLTDRHANQGGATPV